MDCRACGACCTGWDVYVQDDEAFTHPVVMMRGFRALPSDQKTKKCSYLDGEVGKSVTCTIYKDRPDVCRRFEPGSVACIAARRRLRIEEAA